MTINYEIQITHLQNPYLKHFSTISKFPHPNCIKISETPPKPAHSILDAIWKTISEICQQFNQEGYPRGDQWTSELQSTVLSRKFTYYESSLHLYKTDGSSFIKPEQVVEGFLSSLSFNLTEFIELPVLNQCEQLEKTSEILQTKIISDSVHIILHGITRKKDSIYYYGKLLNQCTHQEKIIVSLAMGIVSNHSKKIIRISDTILLHSLNIGTISEIAKDNGYHLWIGNIEPSPETLI